MSDADQIYRKLFDSANVAILIIGADLKFIDCNKMASKMLGLTQVEILGKTPYHPDLSPKYQPCGRLSSELAHIHISKVKQGEDITFEWLHLRKDRIELPVEVSLFGFNASNKKSFFILWKDLSLIKQKEKKLMESEERFRTIFTKATNGIVIFPLLLSRKITQCNEAAYKILGYSSKDDIIGKTVLELSPQIQYNGISSEDLSNEKIDECLRTGQAIFEWIALNKNEKTVWINVALTKINLNDEVYIHALWQDITEKKKYEDYLIKTQKLLNESQRIAGMGSWELDLISNIIYWSDYTYDLLGVEKTGETITLDDYFNLLLSDDRELVSLQLKETILKGYGEDIEHRIKKPNGEIIEVILWAELIRDKNEEPLKLIGIIQDITKRKKVEHELIQTNKELLAAKNRAIENETKFKSYFDNAPDGVFIIDENGEFIEVNHSASRISGYPEDELMKMGVSDILQEKEIEKGKQYLEEVASEGFARREMEFVTKNNEESFWEIAAVKLSKSRFLAFVKDVTEKRKALENLKINTVRYQLAQQISHVGNWEYNLLISKFWGSTETRRIYGFDLDASNFSVEEVESCIPDRLNVHQALIDLIEEGKPYNLRFEIYTQDKGEWKFIKSQAILEKDKNGNPIKVIGVIHDISEQKKAEDEIRLREKHLRSLVENPVGYVIYRTRFNRTSDKIEVIQVSPSYSDILGINEDVLNDFQKWFTLVPPEDQPLLLKGNKMRMKPPFKLSLEIRYTHPEKGLRWLDIRSTGIAYEDNPDLIEYANGLIIDVTERKEAEVKLRESTRRLKEAQELSKIGSWEIDFKSNKQYWSDEVYRILNCIPQEFEASYENFLEYVHPDDKSNFESVFRDQFINQKSSDFVHRILLPGDIVKFLHGRCTTNFDSNGNALLSKGTVADITEQVTYQQELVKAKEKAEESDKLKTAFLQNMSHEIRTPMNGIIGFADLLKEPGLTGKEKNEYVEIIRQSGKRMLNIISDLIDISKIETGQVELVEEEVELNKLLQGLLAFFKPIAEKKGIAISFESDIKRLEIVTKIDKTKLSQVLTNLIGNAIKFTKKGQIYFGYSIENSQLQFYVKDTGVGISPSFKKRIFERFIQENLTPVNASEGSGLGLAISKAYIEKMGGKVWVESEQGKGTEFYFSLPYNRAQSNSKELYIDHLVFSGFSEKLKILIAEDDEISYLYLREILRNDNIQILHAYNGKEAVNFCKKNADIDLVLMDIKMPVLNGLKATKCIKKTNPTLPVIAQSAYVTERDKEFAYRAGCDDYIEKPINKEILYSIFKNYIK